MTAFAGIRVLDFTGRHFAGAMAAMHLADFGAEVFKIDPTDEERGRTEPGWLAWNRNKTRLVLDIDTAEGLAEARRLLADADVAIFDHAPGALAPLGLDGETLLAANPRLVHAWAPPYGETGAYSGLPASHTLLSALTSIATRQPSYEHTPVHLVTPQAWYAQANLLAAAIGAALIEREGSGRGQTVVVTGLHGASEVVTGTVIKGAPAPVLWGSPRGGAPSYRLYECADGEFLFLGTLFPNFYMRALDATGVLGELLSHPEIEGDLDAALVQPGAFITLKLLQDAFLTKPRAEWLQILIEAGAPCGPVKTREEWFAGQTVAANRMRLTLPHDELGPVTLPGVSLKLTATPAVETRLVRNAASPPAPRPAPPAAPGRARRQPLEGVRILDLGNVIAAPYAATILADFGAEVVKVEAPEGDPFRNPPTFHTFNRGKRGIVLDMKQQAARDAFLQMAAKADVVLDNFRHGVRERLGITYADLKRVNPEIITLSVTGYGADTPRQALPAFDPLLQAESGLQQAQGGHDDEPVMHAIPVNDVQSATLGAFGIVAALFARGRTGRGQEVCTSLAETSVMAQCAQFCSYPGGSAAAEGARDCLGASALERFYPCADGWIAIACKDAAHYEGLCSALGLPLGEPAAALAEPRDGPLTGAVTAALAPRSRADVLRDLAAAGVPCAPVVTAPESYEDPFLAENGYFASYSHPRAGTITAAAGYARFGRTPAGFHRPAPILAQHTREVLADYGIPAERIEALIRSGAAIQAETPVPA
jgi:crotonobetainyl-CoA:carnitine CoA-transferase CaiB-like acyl-CoA transferase